MGQEGPKTASYGPKMFLFEAIPTQTFFLRSAGLDEKIIDLLDPLNIGNPRNTKKKMLVVSLDFRTSTLRC